MPTILVIDDEKSTVDLVRQSVPDWTVLSAGDGIDGLDMLRERHETIELVLLDVQMPRMDGKTVLVQIHTLYPHIPVRIFSAPVDSVASVLAIDLTGKPVLLKPISPQDLADEIQSTLLGTHNSSSSGRR